MYFLLGNCDNNYKCFLNLYDSDKLRTSGESNNSQTCKNRNQSNNQCSENRNSRNKVRGLQQSIHKILRRSNTYISIIPYSIMRYYIDRIGIRVLGYIWQVLSLVSVNYSCFDHVGTRGGIHKFRS